MCNNALPGLESMASPEEGSDVRLDMLKMLAEISDYNGMTQDECKLPLENVFNALVVS